ncbi:DUF5718 family protein [Helicobacter sp. MIT 14-3879]|uniref:DUF5718 family protein n=1 Tax=Helicobacter sp. MIT 14-3879 TaxID=2040649 RepID=UPI000E1F7B35|nr:DUF5718 family protein [Helicobacter sp. MIT 14-3879]RDU63151.1 hypothetical protein CQA44_05795 [Helicobacter sp. MIT 14-3879]
MKNYLGFGIAGNFANHLKQAGEANDFANIASDEEGAPKGIFPFYIPNNNGYLGRFCIDNAKLIIPSNFNIQAEAEIAIEFHIIYENKIIKNIIPKYFMAFNDASIRNNKNAKKLSEKKNFSTASKGCGEKILIDNLNINGICDNYSLTSFLLTESDIHQYGNNTKVINYSYFNQKLIDWIIKKLNTQEDHSVLENLSIFFEQCNYPKNILMAIGATSYTPLAENRFLKENDEICVVAYNHNVYTNEDIKKFLKEGVRNLKDASISRQKVMLDYNLK